MKRTKIIYWICTGLFAAFMLFSAIPEVMSTKQATDFITQLGYPAYLNPFLGVAKILGLIAILIPGFPGLKEWAYAGFTFDLMGATYSMMFLPDAVYGLMFMIIPFGLLAGSYVFYHKKEKEASLGNASLVM